ncbi:MAG: hypothetical protein AB8B59_01745 [Maribacter sp.]
MSKRYTLFLVLMLLLSGFVSSAQNRLEREHRIKKSQFPSKALQTILENNNDFKRLKFYKTVDTASQTYTAKFKKARLFYEMDFSENGELTGLGFAIKPIDIPEESFYRISAYLSQKFEKSKVRKMFQFYPLESNKDLDKTIKNAFQNLMISDVVYELFVKGKTDGSRTDFEITFDSEGNFVRIREALPSNYDRVLY